MEQQGREELFEALDAYPWDDDPGFQSGLQAILGSNLSPEQIEELTIRAKCYYYTRQNNVEIDYDAYKNHVLSQAAVSSTVGQGNPTETSSVNSSTDPTPPYPRSFAEIVELITSGAPIPGIKDIPDTVLADQATQPTASMRRKPWEKEDAPLLNGGTFGDRRDDYIVQETPDTVVDAAPAQS